MSYNAITKFCPELVNLLFHIVFTLKVSKEFNWHILTYSGPTKIRELSCFNLNFVYKNCDFFEKWLVNKIQLRDEKCIKINKWGLIPIAKTMISNGKTLIFFKIFFFIPSFCVKSSSFYVIEIKRTRYGWWRNNDVINHSKTYENQILANSKLWSTTSPIIKSWNNPKLSH